MMSLSDLPELPADLKSDYRFFKRVILSYMIWLTGEDGRVQVSQRFLLSKFNRSNQKPISRFLQGFVRDGYLVKVTASDGIQPDEYALGPIFDRETEHADRLKILSDSLWGETRGLLADWAYPSMWGYGCFPGPSVICMAVLAAMGVGISQSDLRAYLRPMVSDSSFDRTVTKLLNESLITSGPGGLALSWDWKERLEVLLASNPACNDRQGKGDLRRNLESQTNLLRVAGGLLSHAERISLRSLPCVRCGGRSGQVEHFPPVKFLISLGPGVVDNRNVVWAICGKCNREPADFIKRLPLFDHPLSVECNFAPQADPIRCFRASANFHLERFYEAFLADNERQALKEIRPVCGLLVGLIDRGLWDQPRRLSTVEANERTRRGSRRATTAMSQLPLRVADFP
jgi:hypothetical protein